MSDETKNENGEIKDMDIDPEEALNSVKLKTNSVEVDEKQVKDKAKDIIVENDSEEEKVVEDEDMTKELHAEFSSFLETQTDLVEDLGTKETIPTGIDLLDAILGSGFVIGALNIIVGQPGSGKSMLAMQALGQGQRKYNGKLIGGFLDSEQATTSLRLWNLGVRYPKLRPYSDITVEKVFKFVEGLSIFKREKKILDIPSVIVWDSIANTLSQKEIETEDPNSVIGYKARLLSILVPKYVSQCAKHNICLLAVNQLRDVLKIDKFAAPKDLKFMSASKDMPGGNILKYNAFQLLEMKVKTAIVDAEAEKYGFEGVIVKIKCVKNKLFPPNVEIEIVGSFVSGFSNFWTNYNFLKTTKRLTAGAWNYLVSYPDKKFRTKDAPQLYKTDDKFKKKFDESVKEAIQTEIVEKYNPEVIQESN